MDITPSTLDHYYDVELADGRIIGLNTILRGCTLNLLNHPFNINLMPVELGSFDAIIGMDWLARYQAIIVCAEKIVRIPWGNETLIVHGDGSNQGHEARDETQRRLKTTKKKRLEDVPIVRDFPEVFPEDLSELSEQLNERVVRATERVPHPGELQSCLAGYYRRFIEGFSKIAKPITKITQKKVKFVWGDKQEATFQLLKQKLCSAPILALPEGSEDFIAYCDTSKKGLGALLM
ncbi:putative reverse transcriptase domain-containing protein [Tanacetum coccineum]